MFDNNLNCDHKEDGQSDSSKDECKYRSYHLLLLILFIQQNSSRIDPNFLYDSSRLVSYATQLRNTLGSI